MISRRIFLQATAAAMLASAASATAFAAEEQPFTRQEFLAARTAGEPIMVANHDPR